MIIPLELNGIMYIYYNFLKKKTIALVRSKVTITPFLKTTLVYKGHRHRRRRRCRHRRRPQYWGATCDELASHPVDRFHCFAAKLQIEKRFSE